MAFPSTLSSFTYPSASDKLNNPSHSALHNSVSSALGQVEVVIGTDASIIGTIIGDLRNPLSGGGGHVQAANKGGTGQTSYTKGDTLVATSASVLAKLAVGTDGQALIADSSVAGGVKWGLPGVVPTTRVYTSSVAQIWNKPSTLSYVVIQIQAPGGSGHTNNSNGAGGGGAGAFSQKIIPANSLPLAASVLVRGQNTGSILSYFGSVLQVLGGTNATAEVGGAAGSVLLGGDINYNGQSGTSSAVSPCGASGGHSYFGKGGTQGSGDNGTGTSGAGQAGIFGGGGGGGSSASDGSPTGTGGPGGEGMAVIYEY